MSHISILNLKFFSRHSNISYQVDVGDTIDAVISGCDVAEGLTLNENDVCVCEDNTATEVLNDAGALTACQVVKCPQGQGVSDGTCATCSGDTYSDSDGSAACKSCGSGYS